MDAGTSRMESILVTVDVGLEAKDCWNVSCLVEQWRYVAKSLGIIGIAISGAVWMRVIFVFVHIYYRVEMAWRLPLHKAPGRTLPIKHTHDEKVLLYKNLQNL